MTKLDIEYVDPRTLVIPDWRATYLLRPEMLVVSASLSQYGFIQPIHVRTSTREIIDGSERVLLAMNIRQILDHSDGLVPAVFHDLDKMDAMMLHLRLNRGHTQMVAAKTSQIIRTVKRSGKYGKDDFEAMLCMRSEELALMLDGTIFKARKIKEHNYARAWIPIEAPSGKESGESVIIERPPNADR